MCVTMFYSNAMDSVLYELLMREAVAERARAIHAAERQFSESVAAIRMTRALAEKSGGNRSGVSILRHGDVVTRVRMALTHMPESFFLRDLVAVVHQQDDVASIISAKAVSSAITRLVGDDLELVERGKGKRGNKYRKRTALAAVPVEHTKTIIPGPVGVSTASYA